MRLPDFYIVGAQKAATTTLSQVLRAHSGVAFSTPKELFLLDRDDPLVNRNLLCEDPEAFLRFDWRRGRDEVLAEYNRAFADAREGQLRGEATTTYLIAEEVPARIAEITPDARVLFVLRHPTERVYSAYWHFVRTRRAMWSFERELQLGANHYLDHSLYARHVRRYLQHIPRDRMHFVLTERLRKEPAAVLGEVHSFLGLSWDAAAWQEEKRANIAAPPRSLPLQLALNLATTAAGRPLRTAYLQKTPRFSPAVRAMHLAGRLNARDGRYPPMRAETRAWLDRLLQRENEDLDALTGLDTARWWWTPRPA